MHKATCLLARCETAATSAGYCDTHFQDLEGRFWNSVAKAPGCWEWTGAKIKGHGRISFTRKTIYAHRLSYELAHGTIPDGMEIDHACRNRSCVNPNHLRTATRKQNAENLRGANRNSKSGVRGVHWQKNMHCWQVTIRSNGKIRHIGYFAELEDAKQAAINARNILFTHNDADR